MAIKKACEAGVPTMAGRAERKPARAQPEWRPDAKTMPNELKIRVNERVWTIESRPDTPLLYVLMNDLNLQGPRFGCGLGQCGSCSVLVNGIETRSCRTPVSAVEGKSVTTLEGLPQWYAAQKKLSAAPQLHPLQHIEAISALYGLRMIVKASELL